MAENWLCGNVGPDGRGFISSCKGNDKELAQSGVRGMDGGNYSYNPGSLIYRIAGANGLTLQIFGVFSV